VELPSVEARLNDLEQRLDDHRVEISRLRAIIRDDDEGATSTRRTVLKQAGMAAVGVVGAAAMVAATATPTSAETTTFAGNIVVRGSSRDSFLQLTRVG
jgi:hypothetical protein